MVTSLGSLPLEPAFGLVAVESGFLGPEVKYEIVSAVAIHVLNVTIVCRACATSVADDIGGSESVPDILTRRIERVRLEDGDRDYSVAVRVDRVLLTPGLDIDCKVRREVRGDGPSYSWAGFELRPTTLVEAPPSVTGLLNWPIAWSTYPTPMPKRSIAYPKTIAAPNAML